MTGYLCPVEGCDFGESDDKTKSQIKGHMNGKADHPNYPGGFDEIPTKEPEEPEETEEPDTDQDDTENMATDDEYQEQESLAQDLDRDAGQDDETDDDPSGGTGGFALPGAGAIGFNETTMLVVTIILVVAALTWLISTGSDDTQDVTEPNEDDETTDIEGGGLIGE